jgi:hypothetical protein
MHPVARVAINIVFYILYWHIIEFYKKENNFHSFSITKDLYLKMQTFKLRKWKFTINGCIALDPTERRKTAQIVCVILRWTAEGNTEELLKAHVQNPSTGAICAERKQQQKEKNKTLDKNDGQGKEVVESKDKIALVLH